jgi:hypothetical protein
MQHENLNFLLDLSSSTRGTKYKNHMKIINRVNKYQPLTTLSMIFVPVVMTIYDICI